ncbi:hypothetical protein, partial [Microbacterium maritypicum]|uniref:hypothetical protein n=1 Tax=Microbacterium maritypicum TaxID=33918 RepID=UPI001E3504C0
TLTRNQPIRHLSDKAPDRNESQADSILAAYGDCRHDGRMLRGTARKLVSSDRVGVALRGSGRAVKTPRHSLVVFCRVCD